MKRYIGFVCVVFGALVLAGCDHSIISIGDHGGVPLGQLALTDHAVSEVSLLGPDSVRLVHGDKLAIAVTGDPRAADALRFALTDGKLAIGRKSLASVGNGTAIVTITTPSVDHLVMAGSGAISSDGLTGTSVGVTIGGSGQVAVQGVAAGKLEVDVLGSGAFTASGHADKVVLTLAGSGSADLSALKAGEAKIDVAGSGSGTLNSDGKVTGSVVGSGGVVVHGHAQCNIEVTGTGKVTCTP